MEFPSALSSFSTVSLRSVSLASSCNKTFKTSAHHPHPLQSKYKYYILILHHYPSKQSAATLPAATRDEQGVYRTAPPTETHHSNAPLVKLLPEFQPFRPFVNVVPTSSSTQPCRSLVYEPSLIRIEPRAGRCVSATVADSFSNQYK